MQGVLQALRALALLAAIACLALFGWTLYQARLSLVQLDATLTDVSRFTQSATGVSADLRKIADSLRKQADAQAAALTQTTVNLTAVTQTLNSDLVRLGASIDRFNEAIDRQDSNLTALEAQASMSLDQIDDAAASVAPAMKAATDTLRNTAEITGDPHIAMTLTQLETTSENVTATTASLERSTEMVEARVRKMTSPKGWAATMGGAILEVGSKIGAVLAGFLKL